MTAPRYYANIRMAIAEEPKFPSEEEASSFIWDDAVPLTLEEWKTYFVKFYGEQVPNFFPQSGIYTQRPFPGHLFEINFRDCVGLTRIGPIRVRVESRKISETAYEAMLDYIAEKYANLVFSFATPLGQSCRKDKAGHDIAYVEYLFLKKYLLDGSPNLDAIAALILSNPHHRLYREFRNNSIDAVTHFDPAMLVNMFSSPERFAILKPGHLLLATSCGRAISHRSGRRLYHAEAIEERKHHTVDTNENRFVKYFLGSVQHRLVGLKEAMEGTAGSYLNPDIECHLEQMEKKIGLFLADPMWHDVGTMQIIPANSQVLQRRDGYRQLFRLYSLMQLVSRCDFDIQDFKNLLETKDTPTLFEYWSFFVVKDILDSTRKVLSCKTVVSDEPPEQRINPGICIQYEGGVSLWFNRTYTGSAGMQPSEKLDKHYFAKESYSHTLCPDIIISKEGSLLIFDAKYRGERDEFYGSEASDGTIQSCENEDIDKMHTYREAIRDVVGAFILYPGEKAIVYPDHDAQYMHEGVGVLPLRPDIGAKPVQEHIKNVELVINDFLKD